MNIEIFSCAKYSNWCFYHPDRILFDVGEGISTYLQNRIYGIENIFISHSHMDHIAGLLPFIGARNSGKGDKNKQLNIYYPNSEKINDLIILINKYNPNLNYKLLQTPIQVDNKKIIDLAKNKWIESFPTNHSFDSVGYRIIEQRNRLKQQYLGKDIKELKKNGLSKSDLSETYFANLFTYGLDSFDYKRETVENCEWFIADSTFLRKEDRDAPVHGSSEELIPFAKENKIKRLTLAHISTRYAQDEVIKFVNEQINLTGYNGSIDIILGDKIYEL